MKVLQINIFGNLSTGRIAVDLYRTLKTAGYDGKIAFARNNIAKDVPHIKIGNTWTVYRDGIMTRLTGKAGFYSAKSTKVLIDEIKQYDPDIIHLHNLHGYYINIEILFNYLRCSHKPVVWTLHDCWAYTGHCCYYSMVDCNRWKTGCYNCPQKKSYPKSMIFSNVVWNYKRKKEIFTSLPNLRLVTVSQWLADEVKMSFLKNIECEVIYNGVDTNIFKPTQSGFRKKYNLEGKFLILGVASTWDVRKRLCDFALLAEMLDENYKIVIVGVNKKEKRSLPENVLAFERTDSTQKLAEIYSSADVLFNASIEETFGMPTAEALACGTPAIVYNTTASPELIKSGRGYVVPAKDLDSVREKIFELEKSPIHISVQNFEFDKRKQYEQYIRLYESLL